jgi:cysteinyl-tRNA synthetase
MLKLYNTLTRQKEIFKPIRKNQVSFYHCGPTVYWIQHIGNLRGMLCADIVVRTLKYLGYQVKHVRNYTDVGHLTGDNEGDADLGEDRMEKAAKREKLDPQAIAEKYIKIFEQDTQELNILEPTIKPRATQCIQEIIEMTQALLGKGYAYTTDLAVYFDVSKAKNYTQLSGQKLEEKLKGAGKAEISDSQKKHSVDFALWFFKAGKHKNALQYWPSPFKSPLVENGQGFPGWHIECSVMSNKYLGKTIDIHMGGVEHISIHHTNEIAQSEAANGVKFVNYWLHNEHLLVNNQKMAKSKGTGYSLEEVKNKGFHPLALRYLFLQAHYRSKQNFTWSAMESAQKGFNNLVNQIKEFGDRLGKVSEDYKNKFIEKISDDFNLPQALVIVQELLKSDLANQDKLATILDFDKVLGLSLDKIRKKKVVIPQEIKKLVEKREKARENKDWAEADELRKQIERKGYQVEDTPEGPQIKILGVC